MYPSIIKENFLSSDEIDFIVGQVREFGDHYDDIINGKLHGYYKPWAYYNAKFSNIKKILEPKFKELLAYDFVIDHSHLLDSHIPYSVHTDYFQLRNFKNKLEPAHTLIIPIKDFNSHTLVFNESSTTKAIYEYIEKEKPSLSTSPISVEDRKSFLSHVDDQHIDYLSIKEIFRWNKGSIHATDRKYFHASDNYHANGLPNKQALIFWTSDKL